MQARKKAREVDEGADDETRPLFRSSSFVSPAKKEAHIVAI